MSLIISIICASVIAFCLITEILFIIKLIKEENAGRDKLFEPVGNNNNGR